MIKMDDRSSQANDYSGLNKTIENVKLAGIVAGSLFAAGGFVLTKGPKAVKAIGSLIRKK